ncbi:MAG TPA: hypothetical protein PKC67_09940 [Kiritimatiellia bacterium]|nr:hypothetical protein [Kiritimatiellia bacterium]HMP34660.1 hypothetical protein [Kiritimatiellia bacterium]
MRRKAHRPGLLDVAARMPPLHHNPEGNYAPWRSEVVTWLLCQPEIQQHVFNLAAGRRLIQYDRATGLWVGRDRRGDT